MTYTVLLNLTTNMCAHVFGVETRNGENTLGPWFSDVDEEGGLRRETSDIVSVCLIRSVLYANCSDCLILTESTRRISSVLTNPDGPSTIRPSHAHRHDYQIWRRPGLDGYTPVGISPVATGCISRNRLTKFDD